MSFGLKHKDVILVAKTLNGLIPPKHLVTVMESLI